LAFVVDKSTVARETSDIMRVRVLYFAVLRERRGVSSETLDLPAGGDVAMALAIIAKGHPTLAPLLPRAQVAVNQVVVAATASLAEGDELALIPPVSGGSGSPGAEGVDAGAAAEAARRRIAVLDRPLALSEVVAAVTGPERGGLVTFTGLVRRHGKIPNVVRLEYEAYRAMAERVLAEIADEIERASSGVRVAIHHRVGSLAVGEAAVVVAAAAPHRAAAFDACRAAIDRLKSRAPIWKKEIGETGAEWIEHCC
jgi:molybdopterin converting factor subunit 1